MDYKRWGWALELEDFLILINWLTNSFEFIAVML